MRVEYLLQELRSKGIDLESDENRLIVKAAPGALTASMSELLRERKADILAFLDEGRRERGSLHEIPPIVRVPRDDLMPLSFTQERLWYLSQVESNPAVFNLPLCLRMVGALDPDVLQQALDTLVARHEVMRTTVVMQQGIGYQRIAATGALPIQRLDTREANLNASRIRAREVLDSIAAEPFELSARPAFRAALVQATDDEFFFLLVIHHIFVDGTSQNILMDELIATYERLRQGGRDPLPDVDLHFVDYAVWQRNWLQGGALEEQLAYWQQSLSGELPVINLPTDFARPAIRGSRGNKEPLKLPADESRELLKMAHTEGATPFIAVVALFALLLHRYGGQEDLLIGVPVANRGRRESAKIVGYVANTLVLRIDVTGNPSFRELLRRVRDTCVGAFRHQDMPFQKLVEALRPVRDLSRTPIYQVFLTYDEVFVQPTRMADVQLERVIVGSTVARQDISIFLRRVGAEVHGSLEYSADLFAPETIRRMIGHLQTLTVSAASQPDRPVAELELQTEEELSLLKALDTTDAPVPRKMIHEIIEARAELNPAKTAVRCGTVALSYADLIERSSAVARVLSARGVRPHDLVGICLERSADMVVGLLGILKTGAAYVPLDPDFPRARLSYMLENSGTNVVLCQRSTAAHVSGDGRRSVLIDELGVPESNAAFADLRIEEDATMYVIYTSGSTGRPKGVEVLHRNVANLIQAVVSKPGMSEGDVLVAVTTLSFDIAVLELFVPLAIGATVVLATRDESTDGKRLGGLIADVSATVMQATPATWRLMLESGWEGRRQLRALCGGEPLSSDLASRLIPRVAELWNMYGPTETTVWSTCARITNAAAVSIGAPIANTVIRVVDQRGHETPLGVPGELLIGGAGVAKGYFGRDDLNRERFVDDPRAPGTQRFYRTGDLVRLQSDGNLQHLGRIDSQVKVRGYRIELGEIEAVLSSLPSVREAIVAVRMRAEGDPVLVAFVAYRHGPRPTVSEIRRALRDHLPSYMVPGLVVELDDVPRTPNGKIDRNQLPHPFENSARGSRRLPPSTPMEKIVADVWQHVLGVTGVAKHDNFFELGGHSLLSMRALAALHERTGQRIDPRLFFFQTVEQIALYLEPSSAVTS